MTVNASLQTPAVQDAGTLLLKKTRSQADPDFFSLAKMTPGQSGWIEHVGEGDRAMMKRLLEMGLIEGSFLEVMHQAPFGGDPIAVKVRGGLIALRRHEAESIRMRKAEF